MALAENLVCSEQVPEMDPLDLVEDPVPLEPKDPKVCPDPVELEDVKENRETVVQLVHQD